jgi:hypothetical protein
MRAVAGWPIEAKPTRSMRKEKEILATWKFNSAAMLFSARENRQVSRIRGKWNSPIYL